MASNNRLYSIIDNKSYPIDQLDNPTTIDLITRCRTELDAFGCAVIQKCIRAQSIKRMLAEAERLLPRTFWSHETHNPYFTAEDTSLAEDHPARCYERRDSGFINSDLLEPNSDLEYIYRNDAFRYFIGRCLGVWPIYCWSDPLASHPYGVMNEGHYFPWHFDGNNFTVSILIQKADTGGVFEYAPDLRSPEDERFDDVAKVLQGNRTHVKELDLQVGDVQIFKGRYSMHRVTRIENAVRRIIALPTYVTNPDSVNRPERSKRLYGRAMPIHYERESLRPDALID